MSWHTEGEEEEKGEVLFVAVAVGVALVVGAALGLIVYLAVESDCK